LRTTRLPSPISGTIGWRGRSESSKLMRVTSSPERTRCAVAPLTQVQPEPRWPGIAWVSSRAPSVLSTISTSSNGSKPAASSRSRSLVIEPM